MKTQVLNLDNFYSIIGDQINLVGSYTQKKYMPTIIRMCRLKPYNTLYGSEKEKRDYKKLKLHKRWVDEFGNSIKIIKNKRTKIIIKDPDLQNKNIPFTDLYGCLPLDKSILMAKLLYLDVEKTKIDIVLVGLDNYLRCYRMLNEEWKQISPLELGLKTLITITENLDIKYYRKIRNKAVDIWIGKWPPHKDFLETIKQNDYVSEILKLTKEKNKSKW